MSSESNFEKLASHILGSVEQVAARFEEGISVVMTGKLPGEEGAESTTGNFAPTEDDVLMDMDEDMMGSPLEGLADSVLGDLMSKQVGPQTPMEHIEAFRAAIRWTEPFILYLIAFQVLMFFLCVWSSRKGRDMVPRLVIMVSIGIIVRCSELFNGYGARNWESFATQNYFDRGGVFTGIMFCSPLLIDCFMMLTCLIREASQLLIEVKTMELKKKKEKRGKKSKSKKDD